ncbi:MAG TPA: presqualene diphosphate synthase HpnD [Pseudolabrys sp.]|nr:presqualene diphosphate synthase HpnD [Pseudolabrys sp.]
MKPETQAPLTTSPSPAARAGGSSFYFAMRLLPREQREAMFEIYSFCKSVDDIADGSAPRAIRMQQLADWRARIDALYRGVVPAGLEGLARTIARFSLRKDDFLTVIEGMEMDAAEDIRAPSLERLDYYCDCVASAVGRLSVRVFGMAEEDGILLAHHLGRALQLTNILRDIDEDADVGRLYLPKEALDQAGIITTEPKAAASHPALGEACKVVVDVARGHFAKADDVLARSPRRATRAPRIMEAAYRRMLEDMIARGWSPPRTRIHISKPNLLRIALRHAFI